MTDKTQRQKREKHGRMSATTKGGHRMISWNTQGFRGKKIQIEKTIERMRSDIVVLQKTLCKSGPFMKGFQTIASPAGDEQGKRGLCILCKRNLKIVKVGKDSSYFVFGTTGNFIIGSVYIPHGRRQKTYEELEEEIRELRKTGLPRLFGGDFNGNGERIKRELVRWKLNGTVMDTRGSKLTRHGHSNTRAEWSELDHFIRIGKGMKSRRARVRRDMVQSDHWPILTRITTSQEKEGKDQQ
eukprot:GHVP01059250.1.p1 GENE.GHVP01059250.1~~GHVP01059250.1.p1  ORF type:complete len:241 (+),score=20.22 GHVP01059250.1:535-1257(+)